MSENQLTQREQGAVATGMANRAGTPRRRAAKVVSSRQELGVRVVRWSWIAAVVGCCWGVFAPNPWLTVGSVLVPPILVHLLWLRGEPPVLLFACLMQWLQASVAVFYTNIYGMTLERAFGTSEIIESTYLSLIGLLVLAFGMRLVLTGRKGDLTSRTQQETFKLRVPVLFAVYVISVAVFLVVSRVAYRIPALSQPLLAATTLRWALVFLLAHAVLTQRKHYGLLALVVSYEFVTGLLSFFGGFKDILFILLVVLPGAQRIFRGWRLAQFSIVSVAMVVFALVWTVIKPDYRAFLNQGTGQQVVLVPVGQRLQKLNELVTGLDRARLDTGVADLVLRVSYVNYFALAIAHVPAEVPHEHGKLWWGSIKHVLMPRFLFPNKAAISDSTRTAAYTGIQVAGEEQGTSISIGYMGESYVDFGRWGMFAPILLLGAFYGFIYRFFVDAAPVKVIGIAMATSILIFGAYDLGSSNIKLVGGNLMGLLVVGLFTKIWGNWLWRLLTGSARKGPARRAKAEPRAPNSLATPSPSPDAKSQ